MEISAQEQELESRADESTAELSRANEILTRELADKTRSEQRLAELTGRLLCAQDEERRHIARELHDVTAQSLGVVLLELAQIQKMSQSTDARIDDRLNQCASLAEQALKEIRAVSYVLHPPLLDQAGLVTALKWYVKSFSECTGLRVGFVDDGEEKQDIDPEVEYAFFRVVQECLTKIRSHATSETADISLMRNSHEIVLQVEDRGVPNNVDFAPDYEDTKNVGVGILGMKHRLKQLGGTLAFQSTPDGMIVTARVPLNGANYDSHRAG